MAKLPNGNFEVTAAFVVDFGVYKNQAELLALELKKCREGK